LNRIRQHRLRREQVYFIARQQIEAGPFDLRVVLCHQVQIGIDKIRGLDAAHILGEIGRRRPEKNGEGGE